MLPAVALAVLIVLPLQGQPNSPSGVSLPSFSKTFTPSTIGPGSGSTLRFDITNNNSLAPLGSLAFVDALPAGVTIATLPNASTTCGGTLTAPAGGGTITFSDGVVGAGTGTTCSVFVNVTSSVVGVHSNISGDLTSDAGNSGSALADLTVDENRPGFSKEFSPASFPLGSRSRLTFTLDNNNEGVSAYRINFSDQLPAGVVIADPANLISDCDATIFSAMPGGDTIIVSPDFNSPNPVLGAPDSCTVGVDVVGTAVGQLVNLSGDLTSQSGLLTAARSSGFASAALEVTAGTIHLTKEFLDDPVLPGATATLRFTIRSVSRDETATNISFSDDLDATLSGLTALDLPQIDICGGGSLLSGMGQLSFSGGTLNPGETCSFDVTIQVPAGAATGEYPNLTSSVTAMVGGSPFAGNQAGDSLFVNEGPTLTKEFAVSRAGGGETVTVNFTIANNSSTSSATDIGFSDPFGSFIGDVTFTSLPPIGFCGAGSLIFPALVNGDRFLTMIGGILPEGGSCSFSVDFIVPQGTPSGTYVNTTDSITATLDGITQMGNHASDSLDIVSAPQLNKLFTDDPVLPGETVTLEFTLTHSDQAPADATSISFSDDLGASLAGLEAVGLPMNDVCGMGSQISGLSTLSFTGGTLAPGSSCTFSVTLQVPAAAPPGSHSNTTSDVTATVSGIPTASGAASDSLEIAALTLSKTFLGGSVIPGETVTLEFTITNVSAASDATNIFFSDSLSDTLSGLQVSGGLPMTPCGAGSTLSGTTTLLLSGGNLTAGTSCTFSATLQVPGGASDGDYVNRTSQLTATIDGTPNLSFPLASDVLSVSSSQLDLAKTFTDDPTLPGGTVTLEFTITNLNPDHAASGITFTDDLDAALSGLTALGLPTLNVCGTGSQISGTSLLTLTGGNLAAGSSCTFSVTLQIPAAASVSAVTNTTSQITGTINGLPVDGSPGSDGLSISLLTFDKSFLSTSVAGSSVVLRFAIENLSSTDTANGVSFSDDLDAVISGLVATGLPENNVCGSGSQLSGTSFLTLVAGVLDPLESCSFDVTLQVPESADAGSFVNTTSNLFLNGITAAFSAFDSLTIEPPPTFAKVFAPDAILAGGTSTLSFTINNTASALAAGNLAFTDNLPAGVVVASPPNASTTCTGGTLIAMAGAGSVSYSGGTVAAGATCTVQINVTSITSGLHVNVAGELTSSSGNSGTTTDTLTVNPVADVSVTKSDGVTSATPGESVTYTVVATNSGPNADPGVTLADAFPSPPLTCTYTSLAAGGASGNTAAGAGNLAETLSMPAGSSATYTVTCNIDSDATGTLSNTATVTPSVTDPVPGNNSATDGDTVLSPEADLWLTKSDGVTSATPGESLTYTIVAANNGPSDDPSVSLTDAYPTDLSCTYSSITSGGASGNTASGSGDLAETLSMPAGSSATYTVTCDIDPTATGTLSNTATISGSVSDPVAGNDSATDADTVLAPEADLSITKDDGVSGILPGGMLTYTLTVTNQGPSDSSGGTITDTLPAGLSYDSSADGCSESGGVVSCSVPALASGGSTNLTFVVTVDAAQTSEFTNSATVNANETDPDSGNNQASHVTRLVPDFSKSFSPNPIGEGGVSTLTFTIDNTANTITVGSLGFTDSLPTGMAISTPNNAANGCGGTLTAIAGSGSVTLSGGTVAAGGICTIDVDVTASTAGNSVNTTGNLTTSLGTGSTATDTLNIVDGVMMITKDFVPTQGQGPGPAAITLDSDGEGPGRKALMPGDLVDLEYTISNNSAVFSLTQIAFTDDLGAVLPGLAAVGLPISDQCGVGSNTSGSSLISFTNGSLAPSSSCTFRVTIQIPADALPGTYSSMTSTATGMASGAPVMTQPAVADLVIYGTIPLLSDLGLLLLAGLLALVGWRRVLES